MLIKSIYGSNFKSLVDFKIDLANFTCLIGLNGSGKSTVLQFVDFLAQQVRGDVERWLDERRWRPSELRSRLTTRKNINFELSLASKSAKRDAIVERELQHVSAPLHFGVDLGRVMVLERS